MLPVVEIDDLLGLERICAIVSRVYRTLNDNQLTTVPAAVASVDTLEEL